MLEFQVLGVLSFREEFGKVHEGPPKCGFSAAQVDAASSVRQAVYMCESKVCLPPNPYASDPTTPSPEPQTSPVSLQTRDASSR